MIDHNIVLINGIEYKAVEPNYAERDLCSGCAIKGEGLCHKMQCVPLVRSDGKNVIFKPHYRPKVSELKW